MDPECTISGIVQNVKIWNSPEIVRNIQKLFKTYKLWNAQEGRSSEMVQNEENYGIFQNVEILK